MPKENNYVQSIRELKEERALWIDLLRSTDDPDERVMIKERIDYLEEKLCTGDSLQY